METQNQLPPNVGAVMHPVNRNYIMFTTFDGTRAEGSNLQQTKEFQEALKSVITVMEYEYFQSLIESHEGEEFKLKKTFYIPRSVVKLNLLNEELRNLVSSVCEDYGDKTAVIMRFFEFDEETNSYSPVEVPFDENGQMVQYTDEEE